jgi:hypothetical protein
MQTRRNAYGEDSDGILEVGGTSETSPLVGDEIHAAMGGSSAEVKPEVDFEDDDAQGDDCV